MIQWLEFRRSGGRYPIEWLSRRIEWERSKRHARSVEGPEVPSFHNAAIEAAFRQSIGAYRMSRWDGPLTLFRPPMRWKWDVAPGRLVSSERSYVVPDNGWSQWAPRLEVVEVPGDHDSMVLEPNVRVLAARMRRVVEAAERAVQPQTWSFREAAE
jgi:thioesterase domain-containing protein